MNSRSRVKFFLILCFIFVIGFVCVYNLNLKNKNDIAYILESDSYSYLPLEAKEYLKEVYEDTGEIILTEKNKQENVSYLNPNYVEYLKLSDEEKKLVSVIPNETVIDFVGDSYQDSSEFEAYYNLSRLDINNDGIVDKNYTSPMKNQGHLGLCWAYAISENVETYLMNKTGETYRQNVTKTISPRHLDYVSSYNGIVDYANEYGNHWLGDGNNFRLASKVLVDGLSLFESNWKYDKLTSYEKLELADVFNDNYSAYEVDSTIEMPILNVKNLNLSNASDLGKYNNYINTIKGFIKRYGGPYIATQAPGYSCSPINYNDTSHHIIDTDNTCIKDGNHAMQIIGWDDNYSYKYCINGSRHVKWTSSCSKVNTVSGKGAWILRNSWGEHSDKYTYLTYNSVDSEYNFVTSLVSRENRIWNYIYNTYDDNLFFEKKIIDNSNKRNYILKIIPNVNVNSQLMKIKFRNNAQNRNFKVYFSESGKEEDYELINNFTVAYPGYKTVNLESNNLNISGDSKIKIETDGNLYDYDISVFTKELSDDKYIITKDVIYKESDEILEDGLYKIRLYSDTYNIENNKRVIYKLYDQIGNDITSQMQVSNNVIVANRLNSTLYLPSIGNNSYFVVKVLYDDEVFSTSKIIAESPKPSIGSGTKDDPYVIMSPQDLYLINYNMDAHFVLGQDIDLTYDTQNRNGLYYNSGFGWTAIGYDLEESFTGSLDGYYKGEYHKIIGLKTSDYGLFYGIDSQEFDISVKNIIFEKAIANDSNLLAYFIRGRNGGQVKIENIAAIDCELTSSNILAHSVISCGKDSVVINSIFSNSTFNEFGSVTSSLSWEVEVNYDYDRNASASISNIQLLGKVNNTNSYYFNALVRFLSGNVKVSNVLFNNFSNYTPYLASRLSKLSNGDFPYLENIYYLNEVIPYYFSNTYYEYDNVLSKQIDDLKNGSSYSEWDNFDDYWKLETVDGVGRIPVLKFVDFQYTSFKDINIKEGEVTSLYDYILPNNDAAENLVFSTSDNDLISLNKSGELKGLSDGIAHIYVKSYYDGYEEEIEVNVIDNLKSIIKFDGNGAVGNMDDVIVNNGDIALPVNSFEKVGYKFVGWNTESDGSGINYNNKQIVNIVDDIKLYAQWKPIKYKIKFISNDLLNIEEYIQEFEYDNRSLLNKNNFIHSDDRYFFKQWNTKEDGSGIYYDDCDSILNLTSKDGEIIVLYAIWEASSTFISFDSNGGSGSMDDVVIEFRKSVVLPVSTFTKVGYYVDHWNTKSDDTGINYALDAEVKSDVDLKLYAIWKPNPYVIRYHDGVKDTFKEITLKYDLEYTVLDYDGTSVNGYKSNEWNTKKDGSGVSYKSGDKLFNLTTEKDKIIDFYPRFIPIQYTIVFNSNNGNDCIIKQVMVYDYETELVANSFENKGYSFIGWNTKEDGNGVSYEDKQSIKNLSTKDGDTVNLYAMWEKTSVIVTFDANNGSDEKYEQIFTYNKEGQLNDNKFNYEGHKFIGWNTKKDGSGDSYSNNQKLLLKENLILYAQWEEEYSYIINKYLYDDNKKYIDKININTNVDDFKKNIDLNVGYSIDVDFKTINNENLLYTGGKTKIFKNQSLVIEFTNIIRGEVSGDGKVNYLDYVNVYNHIYKVKHPEVADKKTLKDEFLLAADINNDGKVNYLDYVGIYNKIKELKGGVN